MRITNLMVGTTTLAVIAAAFAGFLAIEKVRGVQQRSPLRIVFNGSASGLHRGGAVDFDGVPAGRITSIKLESPRKIVAMALLDKTAPIRADTAVGIEFQGLTGVAAISLIGGAPSAPPVPRDKDGIPVLNADWSEQQSIPDTLHDVDRVLIDNRQTIKDAMLSFESYTASLKSEGSAIDGVLTKADDALASFDHTVARIDATLPGLADGRAGELYQKLKATHEFTITYRQKTDLLIDQSRRSLLDISEAANDISRKLDPGFAAASRPVPRRPPRRQ
jgi:phospholipid/cholesterol/gamma-HCH transport system substrate-binding protein